MVYTLPSFTKHRDWSVSRSAENALRALLVIAPIHCGYAQGSFQPNKIGPGAAVVSSQVVFAIGDRLRVNFLEELEPPARTNSPPSGRPRAFYQRADLSGEYTVDTDGKLALPRLGRIDAAGKSDDEVRKVVTTAFEREIGRPGDVHLAVLDRQPIYVVGFVRAPGAVKYAPGMIVIQAVSLAGGLGAPQDRSPSAIETARERERVDQAKARLGNLLARRAALLAWQKKADTVPPRELIEFVGADTARDLLTAQVQALASEADARMAQLRKFDASLAAANEEARTMRAAAGQAGGNLKAIHARIARFTEPDPRMTNWTVVRSLQAEVAEQESRKTQLDSGASQVEQRIAQLSGDRARIEAEHAVIVSNELAQIHSEVESLRQSGQSAGEHGFALSSVNGVEVERQLAYELIKKSSDGKTMSSMVTETQSIQPGDVIKVRRP